MNVGFSLLTLFPGRVGGSESYVRGLASGFAEIGQPEQLRVLVNRRFQGTLAHGEIVPVRSYRPGNSLATRLAAMTVAGRLAPRLAARDVPAGLDLLHWPLTVPIPRLPLPGVLTLHDVAHLEHPDWFGRVERLHRGWAYDQAARDADAVITVSEHARAAAIDKLGLDPGRVEAIPSGIDHARFNPEPAAADQELSRLGLPPRYLLYPANLWPHKNHARLIEALSLLEDTEVALVLTGEDYGKRAELERKAAGARVGGRVRHLGYVEPELVPALYRRAAAVVFPSLHEGFGSPPLEAMASGAVVASSLATSLRETCEGAVAAFDPEDAGAMATAIDGLLADDAQRTRLRELGLERASRFTWKTAAQRHVEVYRRAA